MAQEGHPRRSTHLVVMIVVALLSTTCGGGGSTTQGVDVQVLEALNPPTGESTPAPPAVAGGGQPDPASDALLNDVASDTIDLITASSLLAGQLADRLPADPGNLLTDLGDAVGELPVVQVGEAVGDLLAEVRDRIHVFSVATAPQQVHASYVNTPVFDWEESEKWEWQECERPYGWVLTTDFSGGYDDSVGTEMNLTAQLVHRGREYIFQDGQLVDARYVTPPCWYVLHDYRSISTDRVTIDLRDVTTPGAQITVTDGTITWDELRHEDPRTQNDHWIVNGKVTTEVAGIYDVDVVYDQVQINRSNAWNLHRPEGGKMTMDFGIAKVTTRFENNDQMEIHVEFFDSVGMRVGLLPDFFLPTEVAFDF